MADGDAETMREAVVDAIGRDGAYRSARDDKLHFDPLSAAALYAGVLLFEFVGIAAALFQTERPGDGSRSDGVLSAALDDIRRVVTPAEGEANVDDRLQIARLERANAALDRLRDPFEASFLADFLAGKTDRLTMQA